MGLLDAPADRRAPVAQAAFHKLAVGVQDVAFGFAGDSVGDGTNRWIYQWALQLATAYPGYTVVYTPWGSTSYATTSAVGLQAGTSARQTHVTSDVAEFPQISLVANQALSSGQQVQLNANGKVDPFTTGQLLGTTTNAPSTGAAVTITPAAPVFYLWNGCHTGTEWSYLPTRAQAMAGLGLDVLFIAHGHNCGVEWGVNFSEQMVMGVEALASVARSAEIVLMSQNREVSPATNAGDYQLRRRGMIHDYSRSRGFGFIDICQVFENTGNVTAYLNADGVHPSDALGTPLLVSEVVAATRLRKGVLLSAHGQPASYAQAEANPIYLQDFSSASWDGTSTGFATTFGYTLTNTTAAKDTTNIELPNAQALGLTVTTGGAGAASILKDIAGVSGATPIVNLQGKWVTAAVRMWVASGQVITAMRVQLDDGTGNTSLWQTLSAGSLFVGSYITIIKHLLVRTTATRLRFQLFVDSSGNSSPLGAGTVQRVCVVEGRWHPRLFGVTSRLT